MGNWQRVYFVVYFVILVSNISYSQIAICSWNLKDFGGTKSEAELDFIATIIKDFDVVAIQEVVAKDPAGAQAVARLADVLNRKGAKWDYSISNPTSGISYKSERYAFLWKTSKLTKVGDAWLEKQYSLEIDREPYFATFEAKGKLFTLVNFHAITKSMHPETEIKYFKFLPGEYPQLNLIFCGDFNCPETHTVFNPLKSYGYKPVLKNQKTTLRQQCIDDDCLASEYDNIFFDLSKARFLNAGVILFYKNFRTVSDAESISDHVPIYFEFTLN